jgi:hypothetical protein
MCVDGEAAEISVFSFGVKKDARMCIKPRPYSPGSQRILPVAPPAHAAIGNKQF